MHSRILNQSILVFSPTTHLNHGARESSRMPNLESRTVEKTFPSAPQLGDARSNFSQRRRRRFRCSACCCLRVRDVSILENLWKVADESTKCCGSPSSQLFPPSPSHRTPLQAKSQENELTSYPLPAITALTFLSIANISARNIFFSRLFLESSRQLKLENVAPGLTLQLRGQNPSKLSSVPLESRCNFS